jgi:hypothetical protein
VATGQCVSGFAVDLAYDAPFMAQGQSLANPGSFTLVP